MKTHRKIVELLLHVFFALVFLCVEASACELGRTVGENFGEFFKVQHASYDERNLGKRVRIEFFNRSKK